MKFLLVGSFAHQGAGALIAKGLKQGASVTLLAEPENPYDPLAVRVFVSQGELQDSDTLREALADSGMSVEGLFGSDGTFALGHLGAKYETKAAKAALREGYQFRLASEWHRGGDTVGRLMQYPNGTKLIETGGD